MQDKKITSYFARVLILALFSVFLTYLVVGTSAAQTKRANLKTIPLTHHAKYNEECGSCHIPFAAGFLPKRSWKKLMAGLEDHFGENASLDEQEANLILSYLDQHAADSQKASVRSKRIAALIPSHESPIRITETPFWYRRHATVKDWVWKREKVTSKAKCDSCHREAKEGEFSDHDVHIPE